MVEQLRGFKAMTRIIARAQRPQLLQLEKDLDRIVSIVDRFYELLGTRHWIFHESLNLDAMEGIVEMPAAKAEAALIRRYQDREELSFQIRMLHRFAELRSRMALIERAQIDYDEGRYYSAVLVLVAVMDGFVNDVETHRRRGLHARESDEMAAWDSVVGHHLGLSNAHQSFTKTFRKTSNDEVYELYRNRIVHGMLTHFDNEVVATKAWNRLCAVADWAKTLGEQNRKPDPEPTWGELLEKLRVNRENKKALEKWRPSTLTKGESSFDSEPLYQVATRYLEAWQRQNYEQMARMASSLFTRAESHGQTAGRLRNEYSPVDLGGFDITKLDFSAPSVCNVEAVLIVDGETKLGGMRWIREDETGDPAMPNSEGEWRLISWGPFAMLDPRQDS
jgi:hypothetical protein